MAEKGVKALKTKKISACISKAFYVYSKYEVGESGAKCAKVVLLTQKCRRVEPSDFPEKREPLLCPLHSSFKDRRKGEAL